MKSLLNKAVAGLETEPVRIKVPSLGNLDSIDLPIPVRVESKPAPREEVLDASEELDGITGLALNEARRILEEDLSTTDENYAVHIRAKVSVLQTILTTQARVDEGRFKKRQVDKLGELLDLIRGEEAKLIPARVLN
jgi:hypothetical protein